MKLGELFSEVVSDLDIESISCDTREKLHNCLFFCIKGANFDAHEHIDEAVENGAVAVVHTEDVSEAKKKYPNIMFIETDDARLKFAECAEIFYGSPSSKLKVFAVTGTNGKTTTSYILYQILSNIEKSAYNGTAGTLIAGKASPYAHLTTPDTKDLVLILKSALDAGCKSIALELSSHALDMKRAHGMGVDVAVYTNLSRDHLDYHGTMDNYRDAKAKIFKLLKSNGAAVINADDSYSKDFINAAREAGVKKILTYGLSDSADVFASEVELNSSYTAFTLNLGGKSFSVKTNLISEINVYNLLAAISSLYASGYEIESVLPNLNDIDFKIGRFQYVKSSKYSIIVDYAHTPDGYEKIFAFTNSIRKPGTRVISVFGSAGKRDKGKRPVMGKIAAESSDLLILTEEDYRDEAPSLISQDIARGAEGICDYLVEDNREKAIKLAIDNANIGDIILILGKGTEDFLDREDRSDAWDGDHVVAAKYAED